MTTTWLNIAADSGAPGVGLIVAGVLVVAVLIGAFVLGSRVRRREPGPPRRADQPRVPESGPVREEREVRETNEMPQSDRRMTPHELGSHSSRPSPSKERPRWDDGRGGSFGSGGPGAT
ncbi:hypothetical protein Stsp02_59680 [Streptomyces sp. NBRC 14336]|uniref:DUF6479 family protein n=1 Tax=Streptomyces sp. NBRC 14336 TaxID=3030992 RepID=UPI0024A1C4F6|nr:DUF6479 family protein [Streptomyces sp. NBRC 14336]WBO76056.1 DUF6479 family protein [Streptomyces sp. SBE_14.2]GLW50307.1 hypothetical protein Stsp02_59680 [Streptomyces sp. NBRC 14336]